MIAFSMATICAVIIALMYDNSDEFFALKGSRELKELLRLPHCSVA
jgi:hypothetical protein